ncbi:MAG: long-chain fatty acid--CoA ligase [Cytophagales bacterium]|nr:long-chain fatty acid--CoA ligase [Cytophagales bacterium]
MQTTEIKRLFDILQFQAENQPIDDALASKVNGEWVKYSSKDLQNIANKVSLGLMRMGIGKDDKVAIISNNRPEWNFIDFGLQQIGAVSVPMYPTITVQDFEFIFNDSGVKLVFVADYDLYRKAKIAAREAPGVKDIYTFDLIDGAKHWSEVKKNGEGGDMQKLQALKNQVTYEDLVTLIYTSGTTGVPKGVMLSHGNIISNTIAVSNISPLKGKNYRALSFLPICHIFERTGVYYYIYDSVSIYYAESLDAIGDNLREIRPHTFTTVPRLLEKIYDKILAKAYELKGIKRRLFFWALNLGLRYDPNESFGWWYDFQLKLANKIIFNKWREALGGNIMYITSGAAALQPRLARVFWAAGIKVLEAYGATETSPGVSFSIIDDLRIGCVGPLLENIQVKIAEDGEILVKGPNVMKGYYKRPDLTAQAIVDGWYHTGDVGEMVENKYLKITDRKKEIFKTSGGKYIAPQVLENKFKESVIIEQIMVVGEGEKFPGALIVPNFEGLKEWCQIRNIQYTSNEEMLDHEMIIEKFQMEVDLHNAHFAQYEKVKKFELIHTSWSLETGELTPTMKLKRRVILEKYQELVEYIYQ